MKVKQVQIRDSTQVKTADLNVSLDAEVKNAACKTSRSLLSDVVYVLFQLKRQFTQLAPQKLFQDQFVSSIYNLEFFSIIIIYFAFLFFLATTSNKLSQANLKSLLTQSFVRTKKPIKRYTLMSSMVKMYSTKPQRFSFSCQSFHV